MAYLPYRPGNWRRRIWNDVTIVHSALTMISPKSTATVASGVGGQNWTFTWNRGRCEASHLDKTAESLELNDVLLS
jgi:hypothetical protein